MSTLNLIVELKTAIINPVIATLVDQRESATILHDEITSIKCGLETIINNSLNAQLHNAQSHNAQLHNELLILKAPIDSSLRRLHATKIILDENIMRLNQQRDASTTTTTTCGPPSSYGQPPSYEFSPTVGNPAKD